MSTRESVILTTDVVMDGAGVYDLMTLKELILRDEDLGQIDEVCAQSLSSLEICSLSHNRLTTLEHFQYFVNLIELNLNFNQIETLDNLQCNGLEKLFIASNQIVDISPLSKLPKLNTLSLYGNRISDLDSALHTCRSLLKLRSLDLGGNPCSHDVEGYKFRVLRALPRLEALDGDHVTQLDKDLTEEFFTAMYKSSIESRTGLTGSRPFTAPATSGKRGNLASIRESMASNGTNPFASSLMPRGNVRLFRDDFLNSNPILLEYMAQDARGTASVDVENNVSQNHSSSDDVSDVNTPSIFGFVEKMRSANPLPETDEDAKDTDAVTSTLTTNVKLSPSISTSHLGVDPSDPNTTIRKLLKHIEVLMESLAGYKSHQLDAMSESLLEENRQLQTELNNVPILQEQIQDLKKQVAKLEGDPSGTRMLETKRVKSLEQQNASLQRENNRLRGILLRQTQQTEEALDKSPRISSDDEGKTATTDQDDAMLEPKRLSHSELLDESALIDVELTELILQNEVSLELIRNDIKNTKKEWAQQFQQAKAAETARVRPQTSLGFTSSNRSWSREGIDASLFGARNEEQRLHTSAGLRNGPDVHLLGHVPVHPLTGINEASSSDSSTTNILTL